MSRDCHVVANQQTPKIFVICAVAISIACKMLRHACKLMRPGIGRNVSCASGDCLTSRPKGLWSCRSQFINLFCIDA